MSTSIDTISANRISTRTIFYVSSLLILPVLYLLFYVLKVSTSGYAIEHWLPKLSIPVIPISRSRRSRSPIPIDPDQYGAVCCVRRWMHFVISVLPVGCQVRGEPVPVVNRRDPRTTRSAPMRRVAVCVGGAC